MDSPMRDKTFAKDTFVARKAFAESLLNSAVTGSVWTTGDRSGE